MTSAVFRFLIVVGLFVKALLCQVPNLNYEKHLRVNKLYPKTRDYFLYVTNRVIIVCTVIYKYGIS